MTNAKEIIKEVIDNAELSLPGHFNPLWVIQQLNKALDDMSKFDKLIEFVQELHNKGAYHKKRGFSLHDSTRELSANHMLEEAVELQAEATLTRDHEAIVDESADVLATWLHLLLQCEVEFQDVVDRCDKKLREVFVFDFNEIETSTPGLTRRSRQE